MSSDATAVIRTFLVLQFGNTLAASLIWGVNTLFLLDAGLTNFQAFLANAFFTVGMVVFEVPTGIVADGWGRRTSYLLGTVTLAASTALYWVLWATRASFAPWVVASVLLGLGFTFFSGAVEAWLVDALDAVGFDAPIEAVFGRAQSVGGVAMLVGALSGGVIAQATNLGVPFLIRAAILVALFAVAWRIMRDIGFTPDRSRAPIAAMRALARESFDAGLRVPPIRWLMLSSVLTAGVGFYAFYALQPYLLELYGDPTAYAVAGLAAALVALAQVCGGLAAPRISRAFPTRTGAIGGMTVVSVATLLGLWQSSSFALSLVLVFVWGLMFAGVMPIRQSYLNGMIAGRHRATVLSFDSLMGNLGGIGVQPALGRAADVWSYGASLGIGAALQVLALPLIALSGRARHPADRRAGVPRQEP